MISKLPEPIIDKEKPFKNCKLDRQQYADILTKVVSLNHGCVFAIDGEWGSGKTTFVKMWKQSLVNQHFHVLYFNVWEHDFITDPIIGLISQFRDMAEGDDAKVKFAKIAAAAGKVTTGVLPSIVKGLTKKYLGEDVVEVIESATQKIADSFDKVIDDFVEQYQSMEEFRKALENLVEFIAQDGKPLIFIIDELDRCNPRFAVKVLERVKHLFSVPNIVFILSIDKTQLCHSICGYYGSDNLNAEEYLKRFIDIEYKLPEPDVDKFTAYLYEVYGFDDFFASKSRCKYFREGDEKEEFLKMAHILFGHMHLNLRQMEKICAHIRLVLLTFRENQYVNPSIILFLMFFRSTDNDFYSQIVRKSMSIQELLNHIEETLPRNIFIENEYSRYTVFRHIVWETARLLVSYNLDMNEHQKEELIEKIENNDSSKDTFKLLLSTRVIPLKSLQEAIIWYCQNSYRNDRVLPLDYITQHIELLAPFS